MFDYLLRLLEVFGMFWWGLVWDLLISNFGKNLKNIYLRRNFVFFVLFLMLLMRRF